MVLAVLGWGVVSCSAATIPGNAGSVPGSTPSVLAPSPAGTSTSLSGVPAETPTGSTAPPTPERVALVLDRTKAELILTGDQRQCVAVRLAADSKLVEDLGDDPLRAARFTDLVRLSQDCINAVDFASSMADSVQASAGGKLTNTQVECLRAAYAALSRDELARLFENGLNPDKRDPAIESRLAQILIDCGVDGAALSTTTVGP